MWAPQWGAAWRALALLPRTPGAAAVPAAGAEAVAEVPTAAEMAAAVALWGGRRTYRTCTRRANCSIFGLRQVSAAPRAATATIWICPAAHLNSPYAAMPQEGTALTALAAQGCGVVVLSWSHMPL